MKSQVAAAILVASFALQGCSSTPREFSPMLAAAPASENEFQTAYAACRQLFAEGKLDANGRLSSGGAGAAAGAGAVAAGAAAATAVGGWTGVALASATVVALPFVAVAGAWKTAKSRKNKKEQRAQQAAAGCLTERGYPVVGWEPAKKGANATPVRAAPE